MNEDAGALCGRQAGGAAGAIAADSRAGEAGMKAYTRKHECSLHAGRGRIESRGVEKGKRPGSREPCQYWIG